MFLYIGYAHLSCTKELVRKTFFDILGNDYIKTIQQEKIYVRPHYTFQIEFKENTPGLQEIMDRIISENFIKVAYDIGWDWKSRKYVDRYWKVYSKPAFKAHIMEYVPQDETKFNSISFVHENKIDSDTEWDELQTALDKFNQTWIDLDLVRTQTPPRVHETEEAMRNRLDELQRIQRQKKRKPNLPYNF